MISGYRTMWVLAMFDLPVDDREARRAYAQFRGVLLKDGFQRLQYSVYARCCPSRENAAVHVARVAAAVPQEGQVRVLLVTDKQYSRMQVFWGRVRKGPEEPPAQLLMF